MNTAKFLRTSILKNIFEQLLLKVTHCFNFLMNKVPIRSVTLYRSCSVSCKCVWRLRTLCNRRLYRLINAGLHKLRARLRPCTQRARKRRYTCTKLRARYWFLCVNLIWIYQCVTFFCPVLGWLLSFMMISCLLPHCAATAPKNEVFHLGFLQSMWPNPQETGFGHIYWRIP